jgi:vacuolar-type H+-ATPase subunit I/STV1
MSNKGSNTFKNSSYKVIQRTRTLEEIRQDREIIELLESSSSEDSDSDSSIDCGGYFRFVRNKENREEKIKELNKRIKELEKEKKNLENQVYNLKEISKGVIRNISEVLNLTPAEKLKYNIDYQPVNKKPRKEKEASPTSSVVKDLVGEI